MRRAWIAVSAVTIALTVWLVAISLTRPDWAVRYAAMWPPTWRWLLPTPGNHAWAGAYLLLVAASVTLGITSLNLRRYRELIVLGTTTGLTLLLGAATYLPCRDDSSFVSWVTWLMNLFAGAVESSVIGPGTQCDAAYPLGFQIARMSGLGTLVLGAVATVGALSRQQLDRVAIRRAADLDVVIGADAEAVELVKALAGEQRARLLQPDWYDPRPSDPRTPRRRRAPEVVVVHANRDEPALGELRAAGARVLIGDPTDPDVLAVALRTLGGTGVAMKRLFAIAASQRENLLVIDAAREVLDRTAVPRDWLALESVPRLVARFDDPREARDWRLTQLDTAGCFVDALTHDELLARTIVARIAEAGARRVTVMGDSPLSVALLDELAQQRYFRQEVNAQAARVAANTGEPVRRRVPPLDVPVTVAGPGSRQILREWRANQAPAADGLTVTADVRDWEEVTEDICEDGLPVALVITDPASPTVTSRGTRLTRLYPYALVFVPYEAVQGIEDASLALSTRQVIRFGPSLLQDGGVPEDSWTVLARQQHEFYATYNTNPYDTRAVLRDWGRPTDSPVGRLPEFIREDNLRQLRNVLRAVQAEGYLWRTVAEARQDTARAWEPPPGPTLPADVAAGVARAEHDRWFRLRSEHGWSLPDPETGSALPEDAGKDARNRGQAEAALRRERARQNPNMKPWEELSEPKRADNVADIQAIVRRLYQWGIAPVSATSPGRRFRRRGEVRAHQLAGDRSWTTSAGSVLQGQAGDWWVEGEHGSVRAVSATEFPGLYGLIEGDRYRRLGEVTARAVRTRRIVPTLEGAAIAEPGMWVVTDDDGNSWPVPDEEFRRGYELVPDTDEPSAPDHHHPPADGSAGLVPPPDLAD